MGVSPDTILLDVFTMTDEFGLIERRALLFGLGDNTVEWQCDVSLHPGKLHKEDSLEARRYKRQTAGAELGGAGMTSLRRAHSAGDDLPPFTGPLCACDDAPDDRPVVLGRGVFKAVSRDHGVVAVKHLRPEGGAACFEAQEFKREAAALLSMNYHPNVVSAARPHIRTCLQLLNFKSIRSSSRKHLRYLRFSLVTSKETVPM